ncbi:MAG: VOC family protein [Pseudanabaenaceae cyanobacterium bins.68]|nr:VOC family protein [Pseudanabaenaceae cyanobacterium bins.68]
MIRYPDHYAVLFRNQTMPPISQYLQGIQHIGITVENLQKSLEFYIEVLGGKLVVGETGLVGDTIQNTLFQAEELAAIAQGVSPQDLDIPNLRDGIQALDVRFISFGNTVLELIHLRDGKGSPESPSLAPRQPSHIAHITAKHLSFQVKDSIDLNDFATQLEAECQRRQIPNVVFNRIIRVQNTQEQAAIASQYNSFKFWDQPGSESNHEWGEFEGWSLFYCKGPSGEQLEFNQVTRNVKTLFAAAKTQYEQDSNS